MIKTVSRLRSCIPCGEATPHEDALALFEDGKLGRIYEEPISSRCLRCNRIVELVSFATRVKRIREHVRLARRINRDRQASTFAIMEGESCSMPKERIESPPGGGSEFVNLEDLHSALYSRGCNEAIYAVRATLRDHYRPRRTIEAIVKRIRFDHDRETVLIELEEK